MVKQHPSGRGARRIQLVLLACTLLLGACQGPPPGAAPLLVTVPAAGAQLPSRWIADYPLLETFVNGRGPYWFIVDTGAGVTALSREVDVADTPSAGGMRIRDSSGRTRDALDLHQVDLRIGAVSFDGVAAAVVDLAALSAAIGHPLDGIAGFPLFRSCLLTLDYPRQQVRVRTGRLDAPDGIERLPLRADPLPEIDVSLAGRDVRVLVDSGSLETVALADWPAHVSFRHGPIPISAAVSLYGGARVESVGRMHGDLRFGRHVFREPLIQSCVDGMRLGTGVLRHFAVTFDAAASTIELLRDGADPIDMDAVVGTGMVYEARRGYWVVLAVAPASPAAVAGVRIGDRILRVDGMPVDRLASVADWRWSSLFRFTVERNGAVLDYHVGVARLIP